MFFSGGSSGGSNLSLLTVIDISVLVFPLSCGDLLVTRMCSPPSVTTVTPYHDADRRITSIGIAHFDEPRQ